MDRILAIRNQLIGQKGECFTRLIAQESGNRDILFMEGKQVNGITIIFFDLRVTVFLPADNAFLPDVILEVDVRKFIFVFTDVRECVIELVLDISCPDWKLGRILLA